MNYWEQFGLTTNPYTTLPLVEGGDISIARAFVGREKERKYINMLFSSEDRLCITICGNVGIGKTSFVNYTKAQWKYEEKEKPLFSFRREIEATPAILDKRSFLLEIIGSILREIELIDPGLLSNDFLSKLNRMVDITQTLGLAGSVSAGLLGITVQTDITERQLNSPLKLTTASLEKQFLKLLSFITTHKIAEKQFQGLIVHVNNFEIAMAQDKKKVSKFFAEIRDLLQTPDIYFMFLGPTNLYKDILSQELRVKSVFTQPIILNPLTKEELVIALNKRIELLKSPTARHVIKPFADEVIYELYDLYLGDIRMIMAALKEIIIQFADKLPKTLSVTEAFFLLGKDRLSELEMKITPEQMRVLNCIIMSDNPITQNEISTQLKKSPTNISNYYFKPLIENDIIEIKSVQGRNKYWGLTNRYIPLKRAIQSQLAVEKRIRD